jgi:NADH:ubiquinone oxidoreductase subunit 3 (subunit A)
VNKDFDMQIILTPPVAVIIYFALVAVLFGFGRILAGRAHPSAEKSSTYGSGEASPSTHSLPGYRGFFIIALFFAVLHLGALMLGSSFLSPIALVYLAGLMLALIVLIIG